MEEKLSSIAKTFTPSPIQELSHLAQRCNAINLAEGFPDFPASLYIKEAAVSAINSDFNQYRHVLGICDHLAPIMKSMHGLNIDPLTDRAIFCGKLRHLQQQFLPVYMALDPPQWTLDPDKLMRSFTGKTKAIVLNCPHNPTGKVFSRGELEVVAEGCRIWDSLAITDEVYEYITFDNQKHVFIASLPETQERTIFTSSLSKTFSITVCRIGWAIAPASAASAIRNIHAKITDSAPAPFQEAALTALRSPAEYFEKLTTLKVGELMNARGCPKLHY
ncbi:hypothetical protein REPUB_Repub17cG0118300 [Reevesia pubescens]